jgi:hypothetical protein
MVAEVAGGLSIGLAGDLPVIRPAGPSHVTASTATFRFCRKQ